MHKVVAVIVVCPSYRLPTISASPSEKMFQFPADIFKVPDAYCFEWNGWTFLEIKLQNCDMIMGHAKVRGFSLILTPGSFLTCTYIEVHRCFYISLASPLWPDIEPTSSRLTTQHLCC